MTTSENALAEFTTRVMAEDAAIRSDYATAGERFRIAFARWCAEAEVMIRADLPAGNWSDAVIHRAADIVVSYPTAWHQYSADPSDWEGRYAVALLFNWRKLAAERVAA